MEEVIDNGAVSAEGAGGTGIGDLGGVGGVGAGTAQAGTAVEAGTGVGDNETGDARQTGTGDARRDDGNAGDGFGDLSVLSKNHGGEEKHWLDGYAKASAVNSLRKFKSVEDALVAYGNLEKALGKKGLSVPAADAPEDVKAAYLSARRGGVKSPEEYSTTAEEMSPYGVSSEAFENMRKDLFSLGLSDHEMRGVMRMVGDFQHYESEQVKVRREADFKDCMGRFRSEFGNRAEGVLDDIRRALDVDDNKGVVKAIRDSGLDNNFDFLMWVKSFSERNSDGGQPVNKGIEMESGDASSRLKKLMNLESYKNPNHERHAEAQAEFFELLKHIKR